MVRVAQDIFGQGNDTWISRSIGRIGGSLTDDKAKVLASTALINLTSDQKNQYNNYKMNSRAYADLLQCCIQDIISFGIIDTAKDKNLANGNAALVWKRLSEKFAGCNNAAKMKLINQFNESRMKKMKTLTYGS